MIKIPIVELHFSNKCTGSCIICSEAHGGNNIVFCTNEVVDKIIGNLRYIDFDIVQVGGDGDSFLNKEVFFYALRRLKSEFPSKHICLYTNASMLTPENGRIIVEEKLLNEIVTRIDTLNPILFKQSTGLSLERVLSNIKNFFLINDYVKYVLVYFPLYGYRDLCLKMLGREPARWNRLDVNLLKNEITEVGEYFASLPKHSNMPPYFFRGSPVSLWGERKDVSSRDVDCFQVGQEEFDRYVQHGLTGGKQCVHGSFLNQTYIYPDGSVGLCPYDDGQDTFICGNLMKGDSLADIWVSDKRRQMIQDVKDRKYNGKYPCIDPIACGMYDI